MSFSNKDRAGNDSIHWTKHRQRSFLKVEGSDVPGQSKIFDVMRFAEPDLTELAVDWIGISECQTGSSDRNIFLPLCDCERELQLKGPSQLHSLYQRLEAVLGHPQ